MFRDRPVSRLALPLALFALTGGFGLLAPNILGLRNCHDSIMLRMFLPVPEVLREKNGGLERF